MQKEMHTMNITEGVSGAPLLRDMLDTIHVPIFMCSHGPEYRILMANRQFCLTFGYSPEELPTLGSWAMKVFADEEYRNAAFKAWMEDVEKAWQGDGSIDAREERLTCIDGTLRDLRIHAVVLGNILFVSFIDITERNLYENELKLALEAKEKAEAELRSASNELHRSANTDQLTGLWNRRHFEQVAEMEISRTRRYGEPLSLILVDVDHFRLVNERCGMSSGDQVLRELGRRMKSNLRSLDMLARWGDDEFAILTPHCMARSALKVAEKLRTIIAGSPFPDAGGITVSCGISELQHFESLDAWIKRTGETLLRAKSEGRNRADLDDRPLDPDLVAPHDESR
jgi:diguanylate cyclase (GGDEF)-like protein/PAS domain S-box-containing protein